MKQVLNSSMISALDDILASIGLARRTGVAAPAMGGFAAGAIVGAVAALLLAPTSGDELISKLGTRLQTLRNTVTKAMGTGDSDEQSPEKGARPRAGNHSKYASAQG